MRAQLSKVPDGTCVYAVGDIHGRHDLLGDLQRRIAEDAAGRDARRRVVIYLGDFIDRGPDSRAVIETLATAPLPGFESVHLRGNHETLMLEFLDDVDIAPLWFANGGDNTLESYGVAVGQNAPVEDLQAAFRAALPPAHKAFLDGLALSHVEGGYAFVHAGIRPGIPLAKQEEEDLIWIRDEFLNAKTDHGHVVVHGHSIAWTPEVRSNRIAIDTGAFMSGTLTAVVLDGAAHDFLQTTD
jgi:serine/threonine protein phosphatase 1